MPWTHDVYPVNTVSTPNDTICLRCGDRAGAHQETRQDGQRPSRGLPQRWMGCPPRNPEYLPEPAPEIRLAAPEQSGSDDPLEDR